MKVFTHFFFLPIVAIAMSFSARSQNIDLNSLPPVNDLMIQVTNPSADTVILCLHGGPIDVLETTDYDFYNSVSTFSVVYVRQYQQWNTGIASQSSLTLDDAIACDDTTVAFLRKVVNHFNNQSKTVVVTGHSFGAFIIAEYLDDYGNTDIHRVIPMAGRLNMNNDVWNAFSTGYWATFSSDGLTPQVNTTQATSGEWAFMKLMAGYGYNRHLDSLSGLDLTNLMYMYGEHDVAVGRLIPDEVNFLTNANATVLGVPAGDHGSMFGNTYMQQALAFIRGANIADVAENNPGDAGINIYPTVSDGALNIQSDLEGELVVITTSGKRVYSTDLQKGEFQVQLDLTKGMYLVNAVTARGTETRRIIIR